METAFKVVFFLAVILFCAVVVGFFLLILKIILLFSDQIQIMGMLIIPAP